MKKIWFPQRSKLDSTSSLLKNFMNYLNFPVSKYTIEKDTREHPDYPEKISLATIMQLLEKWGITYKGFRCGVENLKDIASPSILYITEPNSDKAGEFIMFYGLKENTIEYLNTRKGWVLEDLRDFSGKFNRVALSAISIEKGEEDFELKEKEYHAKKIADPDLNNIRIVDDFLTDEECDYIINLAQPLFKKSAVMDNENIIGHGRTSFSAELHVFPNNEILNSIRKKAAELIKMPENHFEFFQCVFYDPNQEYQSHYDTFDEKSERGKKTIEEGGQRKYTMLAYLNEDFEGGGTYFPYVDLFVQPKKRRVVIFNNLDENEKVIKPAFHAGLPVTIGRKYAINIWVRNKSCR